MSMKLEAGLDIDYPNTFGELRFWGLRRERQVYDEENNQTGEVARRTYNLVSTAQQDMITVIIPGTVPVRDFPQDTPVELVNPEINSGANKNFRGAEAFWWITAEDIVAVRSAPPQTEKPLSKSNTDSKQ